MNSIDKTIVTVEATVNAPVDKVWEYWSAPQHITKWNQANEDWHCPKAENDLRKGGKFSARMEAKDEGADLYSVFRGPAVSADGLQHDQGAGESGM